MKGFNGKLLKTFIWVVGVGFLTVVVVSLHELVLKQRVKLQAIAPVHAPVQRMSTASPVKLPIPENITQAAPVQLPAEVYKPTPSTHVGFLKVHKAASTTTQAIFLRFGWRRNLTFVLPPEYNKFGYPNIISTNESLTKYNILPPPPGKSIDILCHHVVFGEKEWDTFLPSDSKYVGTVREPFRLFRSTLNYFNPRSLINAHSKNPFDPIGTFLKNPEIYESKNIRYSFTNNRIAFEYGVSPEIILNRDFESFDKFLHEVLDKRFAVVIIAELYDESLVMTKRKLNWELNDILYAIKNVRSMSKEDRYEAKEEHKPLHRNFAIFDYLLYEFFEKRMNRQIQEEGASFLEEVNNFKEVRKYIENFCHTAPKHIGSILVQKSAWNEEFKITREDCDTMHKGEIQFTQLIRKEQYGSATWTGPVKKQLPIINSKPKNAKPV